ncbi:hypothetical protein ACIG87_13785 [Micromonospora sp. NPDC051925]|uniref:hypothetical protein n=1 Tax=Micromonospora sp. NPDC051925 TaxID=3364288 RepID=UPI0037C63DF9
MSIIGVSRSRGAAAVVTAAVSLTLVAGCNGAAKTDSPSGAQGTPGVASIQKPSTAASAKAVAAERPLIRLDSSDEEIARLRGVYIDCMLANGFPRQFVKGRTGYPTDLEDLGLSTKVLGDIKKNCASKEPESTMARAQRLDPAYADHLDANIKCLNDHGVKAVVQDGSPALVDGLPSESEAHWLDDCEKEAFGSYYSTLK